MAITTTHVIALGSSSGCHHIATLGFPTVVLLNEWTP